jgi:hypothetical protein
MPKDARKGLLYETATFPLSRIMDTKQDDYILYMN